jgi:predicted metal-binding protein
MAGIEGKDYIAVVQCDIVKERCSGYQCEKAFHERGGGFSIYAKDQAYRTLYFSCGGCCGRALGRKLGSLVRTIKKKEEIDKDRIVVQLSSCITRDNHHGPPCPHLDYLKTQIAKVGLDVREDTSISPRAEERRKAGIYASPGT